MSPLCIANNFTMDYCQDHVLRHGEAIMPAVAFLLSCGRPLQWCQVIENTQSVVWDWSASYTNPSSFMKAIRNYTHSFFRRVVFRLCFCFLANTKESSQKVLMDTNHWFSAKKPIEVKGKLCPRRLIKELSVSLDITAPQKQKARGKENSHNPIFNPFLHKPP